VDLACVRRRGRELQVGFILLPGARLLAGDFEGDGEIVMGNGLTRLWAEGFLVLADSSVKFSRFQQAVGKVNAGDSVLGTQPQVPNGALASAPRNCG